MELVSRYFIQYMIKHGITSVENALEFCKHVSEDSIKTLTHFKTMLLEINREISKESFKIVMHTCEVTRQNKIVFLNTKNDDIAKLQKTFSELELEYFHSIMEEILNSEFHRVTFIVAINLTSTLTGNFSRDGGQKVLKKWIKNGYFVRDEEHIYLGPRLILEFTSFLKLRRPDSNCNLCSELVFVKKVCLSCEKLFHSYCLEKYLSDTKKCPSCGEDWEDNIRETVPEIAGEIEYDDSQDLDE